MTREKEICNAVENSSILDYYNNEYTIDDIKCAFIEGAEWTDKHPNLSSLWHLASEEPKGDDWKVLCQDKYGDYFIVAYNPYETECDITWDEYTNSLFISKWIYITDILPKGGEE